LCQFGLKLCTVTASKQDSSAELCPEVSLFASMQVVLTNRVTEYLRFWQQYCWKLSHV